MKQNLLLLIACNIMLYSCSKNDDALTLARPIKKDVIAPIVTMTQPGSVVDKYSTTTATITATDDMALKSVYYYENGVLARSWSTNSVPGCTATSWELSFPFQATSNIMYIRVVCTDLAGNITEINKTITALY